MMYSYLYIFCMFIFMMSNLNKLKVSSFNCRNVKSSLVELQELCNVSDIVLLQETWLLNFDLCILNQISDDFYAKGISSMNVENDIVIGRPHGGLAFLWRKTLGSYCKPIVYDNEDRIMGFEFKYESVFMLFLNIYMPVSSVLNLDDFILYINKVNNLISLANTPIVYAIGDFNADLVKQQLFGVELQKFCREENIVISDSAYLSLDTYTYYSEAHGSTSWLDHVISTSSAHDLIEEIKVCYDFVTSDHFPLCIDILINSDMFIESNNSMNCHTKCFMQWDKMTDSDKVQYERLTEKKLSSIVVNNEFVMCNNTSCNNIEHRICIDNLYESITQALIEAGTDFLSSKTNSRLDQTLYVPGWNNVCKDAHAEARQAFLLWRTHGSPKQGTVYEIMKRTRAIFKLLLRKCKIDKDNNVADSLAQKFLTKSNKDFWSDIRKECNNKSKVSANTINGVSGKENICEEWCKHYKDLLNTCTDFNLKEEVLSRINSNCVKESVSDILFTNDEVVLAIKAMKTGKSPGIDGLSCEHYIYANDKLHDLLRTFINAAIIHGYIPGKVLETVLVPIIKDKKGIVTNKDNYRPIAIANVASKIVEMLILLKYENYLTSSENQFGFKKKSSTDMCIFLLKEVIDYFNSNGSPVYVCFMDASKAFDRVNHWHLFAKLLKRGLPNIIVRLLCFWYTTQTFVVKWQDTISSSFTVSNGVRQGGVLSPYLYNIFIDELSILLNNSFTGCVINSTFINHLFYADDSVILAPSPTALQRLINVCETYANNNDIQYNVEKTRCMCIKPKDLKNIYVPEVYLNGNALSWTNKQKYLGVYITDNRYDSEDLSREVRALYARGNLILRKFSKCNNDVKCHLFKMYFNNLYCNQLWSNFRVEDLRKVRVAYNNIFRFLMKIPRTIDGRTVSISREFVKFNIDSFDVVSRKSCVNLRVRLFASNNSLITCIFNSHFFVFASKLNARWCKLIF